MSEIATELKPHYLDLVEETPLGGGSFGKVYLTKRKTDGQHYAVKRIHIPKYVENYAYKNQFDKIIFELKKEVEFLATFRSDYVVSYFDCWFGGPEAQYYRDLEETKNYTDFQEDVSSRAYIPEAWLYIKMGYCQSNLRKWLKNNNTEELRKPLLSSICEQILQGLEYIHRKNVIHRDIKPSNILIKDELSIQIGDFGLSTKVTNADESLTSEWAAVGTPMYRSPEMWDAKSKSDYNCKTDIYSAGLVFIEIVTLSLNSENERENAFRRIREGSYDFHQTESLVNELLRKMTNKDFSEENRPSASRALSEIYKIYPELRKAYCHFLQNDDSLEVTKMKDKTKQSDSSKPSTSSAPNKNDELTKGVNNMPSSSSYTTQNSNGARMDFDASAAPKFKTIGNEKIDWPIKHGISLPVDSFVGRNQELKDLESLFLNNKKLVLVCGFGGLGKTELCRKFMQNISKQIPSRVWLHGDTFESLKSSVFSLARKLIAESEAASPSDVFEYLTELTLKHCSRMVVVIDNVDSKSDEVSKVIRLIRKHENIFIIVTSRNKLILENAGQTMILDVLSKQDARNILQNCIENISDSDADSLSKLVQFYPLALQQAVAYIKEQREDFLSSNYSVSDYVKEFEEKKLEMLDQRLNDLEHDYAMTTLVTWDITFDKLSPEAIVLLKILAFLDPEEISVDFFQEVCVEFGYSNEKFKVAVNSLKMYSLIKVIKVENLIISIHRLVQEVMRGKVETKFSKELFDAVGFVFAKRCCSKLKDDGEAHLDRIVKLIYVTELHFIFYRCRNFDNPIELLAVIKSEIALHLSYTNNHFDCLELCSQVLNSDAEDAEHYIIHLNAFRSLIRLSKNHSTPQVIQLLENSLESKKSTLGENHKLTNQIKIFLASFLEKGERKLELVTETRNYLDLNKPMDQLYRGRFLRIIIGEDWVTRDIIYKYAGDCDYSDVLDMEDLERLLSFYKALLGVNDEHTLRLKNTLAKTFYWDKDYTTSLELIELL